MGDFLRELIPAIFGSLAATMTDSSALPAAAECWNLGAKQ